MSLIGEYGGYLCCTLEDFLLSNPGCPTAQAVFDVCLEPSVLDTLRNEWLNYAPGASFSFSNGPH